MASIQHVELVANNAARWKIHILVYSSVIWFFEAYYPFVLQLSPYYKTELPSTTSVRKYDLLPKNKPKFSFLIALYQQCIDSAMIYLDIYVYFWDVAVYLVAWYGYGTESEVFLLYLCLQRHTDNFYQHLQYILFAMILAFASLVLALPLALYQRFVLEAQHNFDTSLPTFSDLFTVRCIHLVFSAVALSALFKWSGNCFSTLVLSLL
jgi:CAAX prenyl protease N-terminal, five membrane helices